MTNFDKLDRQQTDDGRQTDDKRRTKNRRHENFVLQFRSQRGPKRGEKMFQPNQKKNNFRDCSNISPSGLWTYDNSLLKLEQIMLKNK